MTGFTNNDPNQAGIYANQPGCNGVGSVGIFGLEVPRDFKVPSTQQWNLTLQRDLGHNLVAEVGYVGTHSVHLRETRDAIQSVNATPQNPFFVTTSSRTVVPITANTAANGVAARPRRV